MTDSDTDVEVEIERLIEEVSVRPAIWDLNSFEYHMKEMRRTAWREICNIMFDDFESKSEAKKLELHRLLQRKWKGLRDNFVREQKQITKNKGKNVYRRKYLHWNVLSFLQPTVRIKYPESDNKEERDPLSDENNSIYSEERETSNSIKILQAFSIPKSIDNSQDSQIRSSETILPVKYEQTHPDDENEDEDRLFLLSLVKDLKKIPEHNKLAAKSEFLLLLDKWKNTS